LIFRFGELEPKHPDLASVICSFKWQYLQRDHKEDGPIFFSFAPQICPYTPAAEAFGGLVWLVTYNVIHEMREKNTWIYN